jgi:hypothetical protein
MLALQHQITQSTARGPAQGTGAAIADVDMSSGEDDLSANVTVEEGSVHEQQERARTQRQQATTPTPAEAGRVTRSREERIGVSRRGR